MNIRKLVKPNIRELTAYQAEDIPCRVKLDANESPYGLKVLKTVRTNRYPDPGARSLRKLAARELKIKTDNILHGNGSDELIYYLITTFGGPVMYPVPTFSMYGIIAQGLGEKKIEIPLDREFDLDLQQMLNFMKKRKPKLTFLSSPNNPTGNCFSADRISKIIGRSPGLVIVDEAYQPFSDKRSFLPLLKKHRNLIVLRTLSKIGLAGLRIGFMIACEEIVHEVNKVRLPFNLNSLSQKVAVDALQNRKKMRAYVSSVKTERKRLATELGKLEGIRPYPTDANFILFRVDNADNMYRGLIKKGVLVRNMSGVCEGCLRVTVGTAGENTIFLRALKQLL